MSLLTVSQVSNAYGISTRMLRYYEQAGLLRSFRKEDYAYRVYDEAAVSRLRQIIILRKLRVPVRQIARILDNFDATEAVEIFRQNISEIDGEITALSTVKAILTRFVKEIQDKAAVRIHCLEDEGVFSMISTLSFSDNHRKDTAETMTMDDMNQAKETMMMDAISQATEAMASESLSQSKETMTLDDLNKAEEALMKLEDKDVRIVYLPPMTVAAAVASGEGCEGKALDMISKFTEESGLLERKPDARSFGFDCSGDSAVLGEGSHRYEVWVSIPDGMEIHAPLAKRSFRGGLYAAHVLRAWDFQDWRRLREWVDASDKYDNDWGSPRWESSNTPFGQGFEETLNFYNFILAHHSEMSHLQIDLLFPIREKQTVPASIEDAR